MKRVVVSTALICLVLSTPLRAQVQVLRGEVLLVGEEGETTAAAGVEVTVKETGGSDVADGQGVFRITLSQAFPSPAGESQLVLTNPAGGSGIHRKGKPPSRRTF